MGVFTKTKEQDELIQNEIAKLDKINTKLSVFSESNLDFSDFIKIKENFKNKIEDFYRENRKLNIAVIGQVKAGKSSFLNTLLFNGKEVLPKAVTPKTAVLTKIEYSDKNEIEVDFYSKDEWKDLEYNANLDLNTNQVQVAKEIMKMMKKNNIEVDKYLGNNDYKVEFETYDDLKNELNEYVGENGKYTPLIKSVTIKINNEYLKEISIIDTPGLNDPVVSRTDKTKQFIEICDVVFFLSKADRFLDKSDIDLLTAQLPKKGVKELVLICSQFDSGLLSTIYDEDDLSSAKVNTKIRLKKMANKIFEEVVNKYKNNNYGEAFIEVIQSCKTPIFISTMAENMSTKEIDEFNEQENIIYEGLNIDGDVTLDVLREIGNFKEIREKYQNVIDNKEKTLLKKSEDFIPTLQNEINMEIDNLISIVEKRTNSLKNEDKDSILTQKSKIKNQMNLISASIENIFGDIFVNLEKNKTECVRTLREDMKEYSHISEKTGTITRVESYSVSTSKWYNPFTWGSSRTEYYTYDEHYTYIDVSDAIENIRNFANESCSNVEDIFNKVISTSTLKSRLLRVIIEEFDTSSENYDPAYFKLLVEKTLNKIELPIIKIDISNFINNISGNFTGEVTDSNKRQELKSKVFDTISNLFEEISNILIKEIAKYKKDMEIMKTGFSDDLLKGIYEEFDIIVKQFEDKENEIKKNEELLNSLNEIKREYNLN